MPEIGKTYNVKHTRKGYFTMRVTSIEGEWITGEIITGTTRVMNPDNERGPGDKETIRESHSTFAPVSGN